ncbi:U3 small nucleolar RNA-associated protein 6-domain-containing protein [Lipomyces kononenkoae]|uniref:U3 small nucleolar RNA-associated protein 6-domain-containing protein n=1 Tax=Lipomyces kononenkoae TaxID=34357 RepID=A0ACC3T758_LIPKO
MAEKVRYYLEQTLPELEDLQKRGVFSKPEIASITRRRTDFEHRIHGRGANLLDFLKYAEFEMNLDLLRKKRFNRLVGNGNGNNSGKQQGPASVSTWSGQQRIFFIFDRATDKFKGDINLWMQYISYARQQKARHLLKRILKTVLRLHPTRPELWVLAAEFELRENANRKAARNLILRGLKFNANSNQLVEAYQKLEADVIRAVDELNEKKKRVTEHNENDGDEGEDEDEDDSDGVDHESGAEASDGAESEVVDEDEIHDD